MNIQSEIIQGLLFPFSFVFLLLLMTIKLLEVTFYVWDILQCFGKQLFFFHIDI